MKPERRKTRQIHVGGIPIGGDAPIVVLQHPETLRRRDGYADMQATLRAVLAAGRRLVLDADGLLDIDDLPDDVVPTADGETE